MSLLNIIKSENQQSLPKNFYFKNVKNVDLLKSFLEKNYIINSDNKTGLSYPITVLIWLLRQTTSDLCIGLFYQETIIGFISAKPILLSVNGIEQNTYHINLLCIHREMVNNNMESYLIKEMEQRLIKYGIGNCIFTSIKNFGNPNSKTCLAGILIQSDNPDLQELIPVETKLTGMRLFSRNDTKEINSKLQEYMSKFKVYEIFTDEQFIRNFHSVKDGIYSYVLWKGGNPVGFISFYCMLFQEKKIAYIYYYYGNINELIKASITHLKKNNFKEIRFYLTMDNHNIEVPSIIMKDSQLYYYLYQSDIVINSNEMAFVSV